MTGFTKIDWEAVTQCSATRAWGCWLLHQAREWTWGGRLPYFSLWVFGEKAFVPVLCKHLWEWRQTRPVRGTGMAPKPGCGSESVHAPLDRVHRHMCGATHSHWGDWLTGLQSLVLALTDLTRCQQCPFTPQNEGTFFSPSLPLSPREGCSAWNAPALCQGTNPRHLWREAEQKSLQWRHWKNICIFSCTVKKEGEKGLQLWQNPGLSFLLRLLAHLSELLRI